VAELAAAGVGRRPGGGPSLVVLVRRRSGEAAGAFAWCSLALAPGASVAGNVSATVPDLAERLVNDT
jgi:hypothetical protein